MLQIRAITSRPKRHVPQQGQNTVPSAPQMSLTPYHPKATISRSLEQNSQHFNEAREKLEKWADDMVLAAEKALKDTKEQIKLYQRQEIFKVEDDIIEKRDSLIGSLERRLTQKNRFRTPVHPVVGSRV